MSAAAIMHGSRVVSEIIGCSRGDHPSPSPHGEGMLIQTRSIPLGVKICKDITCYLFIGKLVEQRDFFWQNVCKFKQYFGKCTKVQLTIAKKMAACKFYQTLCMWKLYLILATRSLTCLYIRFGG